MRNDLSIRGILFDLDDTLINCKKAEYNAISEFKDTYHDFRTIDNKEFARLWNKIAIEIYDKYHRGEISFEKLKNKYKLVIVSNGDGHQQRKKIEYTGLQKYFSEIIISSEVGASKPDKEIFKIACKK